MPTIVAKLKDEVTIDECSFANPVTLLDDWNSLRHNAITFYSTVEK
jgi:hypothetical protein